MPSHRLHRASPQHIEFPAFGQDHRRTPPARD
jgi:hypothetical protein